MDGGTTHLSGGIEEMIKPRLKTPKVGRILTSGLSSKEKTKMMKFSITNHGGQFQYWHMDCCQGDHESPMYSPKILPDDVKEFECVGCNKVGRVTLPKIIVGNGELKVEDGKD